MAAAALLIAAGTPVQAQTAAPAFELLAEYLPCDTCAAPAVFLAAVGDYNGDGRDDIATIVYGDSGMELHVLLSRKGGRLEPRILPLSGDGLLPAGLEAIDFDGDGYDEVLVTAGFELRLFRLRADGTFSETVIPGEDRPSHAGSVVADFDGDGAVDIATHVAIDPWQPRHDPSDPTAKLVVQYGNGAGGVRGKLVIESGAPNEGDGQHVHDMAAGDVNGDGLADIVMVTEEWNYDAQRRHLRLAIHPATATGFAPRQLIEYPDLRLEYKGVAIGDFDSDGRNDIAAIDGAIRYFRDEQFPYARAHYRMDFYNQLPDGRLALSPAYGFAPGEPVAPIARDLDLDGDDDLLMLHAVWGELGFFEQVDGVLGPQEAVPLLAQDFHNHGLAVGDFDWDGCPDAAVSARYQGLLVLRGTRCTGAPRARADFDGDGASDLLWSRAGHGDVAVWPSAVASEGRAIGRVADADWAIAGHGDFDGDGRADVLWRNARTGANVAWLEGDPGAPLALAGVASQDWQVRAVADFDGDGRADLFWRNAKTGANAIWPAADHRVQPVVRSAGSDWSVAGAGDLDGDGRADLLWRSGATGANVAWPGGRGEETLAVRGVSSLDWGVAAIGDFDGDGRDDLFWRNARTGANVVWRGGDPAAPITVAGAHVAWQLAAIGDFDGDGKEDVVWRHGSDGTNVAWRGADAGSPYPVADVADPTWRIVK